MIVPPRLRWNIPELNLVVLAIAAAHDMEIHQIDIKGAYLNGHLAENKVIYMYQPPGFIDPEFLGFVCRLDRLIYGLRQSGRHWY
jgi:hypothetical protein